MKQILVMMAAAVLVGCGKNEPELRSEKVITPNEAANELFVEAVGLISRADETTGQSAIDLYEQGLGKLEEIITKHSKSDLAVKLISGETLFTNRSLKQIRDKVAELKLQAADLRAGVVKMSDPIVEGAVRKELQKPEGKLTEADLEEVTTLGFIRTKITDAGLKEVAKLQNLTNLNLYGTKITGAGLKELTKLQNLEWLYLTNTEITDAGLKELAKLQKLRHLSLNNTQITDAGLKDVAKLQKLKQLNFRNTKVTKAGVAELKKALPNCFISGP